MGAFGSSPSLFLLMISCVALLNQMDASMASESEAGDGNDNGNPPFTYVNGTGKDPSRWGLLNPKWTACANGRLQSPIDLSRKRVQISHQLGKLKKDYRPAPAIIVSRGHDVTVRWRGDAGDIVIDGTRFHLLQCHWHTPTEHAFDGTRYQLELHMVHLSDEGKIAVIGILYEYGHPDPFLEKLFPYIKVVTRKEIELGVVNPWIIEFGSRKYFRYNGSLTVPPCTEGVTWTIVKKVRTASREQIKALREAVDEGFENNARPIQPQNGRPVYLYSPSL